MATITLTPSQAIALDGLVQVVNNNRYSAQDIHRFCTLIGPAGSGKTTLLWKLIENIPSHRTIAITTPTHKSAKVVRRIVKNAGLSSRVHVGTIHSVLGLTMKQVRGDEVLVKEPFAEEKRFDVLVIDEAGMLNDELLMYILQAMSDKIVFVGDKCQIGPIESIVEADEDNGYMPRNGDDISRVFTDVDTIHELTDIVRQAKDSPIIRLATNLRIAQENIYYELPPIVHDVDINGNGIVTMSKIDWLNSAVRGFSSSRFKEDPDVLRIVCYTNDCVDEMNARVRERLYHSQYPDGIPEYLEDEILVAQGMGKDWKNADELRIVKVEDFDDIENELKCHKLTLENLEDHTIVTALVPVKEDRDALNFRLNALAERANADKMNSHMHWASFWATKKRYSEFKHIYACTAHKSQGSTFDYTYVYLPDFLRFGATMTVKRLLYTATTRSRYSTLFAL